MATIELESADQVDVNRQWSLLIQGPPKSGKTTLALQFPRPFLADLDNNSGGTIRWQRAQGKNPSFKFCIPDMMKDPKNLGVRIARPIRERYTYLCDCLALAAADPDIDTLIIDGVTKLNAYIIGEIGRQKPSFEGGKMRGPGEMSLPDWNTHGYLWQNFVTKIQATDKMVIFTAHEEYSDIPNLPGVILINMQGKKIQQSLAGMFTDVWRCEVIEKKSMNETTYIRQVRTMQTNTLQLGNTLNLPPTFVMDWPTIERALKANASSVRS